MTDRPRGVVTLVLGAVGAFVALNLSWLGLMVGVMGTDACGEGAIDAVAWWIVPGYPAVLLVAAFVPALLHRRGAGPLRIGLSLVGIVLLAVAWMVAWSFMVGAYCA